MLALRKVMTLAMRTFCPNCFQDIAGSGQLLCFYMTATKSNISVGVLLNGWQLSHANCGLRARVTSTSCVILFEFLPWPLNNRKQRHEAGTANRQRKAGVGKASTPHTLVVIRATTKVRKR